MKTKIGCLAVLASVMGMAAEAAAMGETMRGAAGNRGLSPIITLPIGPMNLVADTASAGTDFALDAVSQTDAQGLLDYAQSVIQGEELMFIMDIPAVPALETPIVLVQADTTNAGSVPQPDYILKYCTETESTGDPRSAMRAVSPAGMLRNYLQNKYSQPIDLVAIKNVLLIEGAKHGEIVPEVSRGLVGYWYDPEPEYVGKDRAVFMAEYQGVRYKIVVDLRVFLLFDEKAPVCPPPQLIKVTKPSSGGADYGSDYYELASVSVTFADLAGAAVGQTVGSTITLDTNAAGNGWYIDSNPWDNSEYLPTSNPSEWVAKEGTDAYGKMDMLSVLLHEYGHALGIDHSADNHDYMATTLTAGVRRLPSAEEMALMQELVAQIKGEVTTALSPSPSPASGRGWPAGSGEGGGLPLPIPLGAGFGIAFMGRLRGSRYGDMSIAPDYATLTAKYAVAANATFANLDSPAGWNSQGSADITPSTIDPLTGEVRTASVTLNEVSTSQTRLSQVFMLNEQDRYLSFTLAGAALDDLNGAPDDAFEVALLAIPTSLSSASAQLDVEAPH